jgi:glycosyltransferase involved in cell wall biosynthesis
MLATVGRHRRRYQVAHVELFSGSAFLWAELVCLALRRLGKPYVLTLHGGNLPQFARRRPGRVTRLLRSAAAVTAPSAYLVEAMRSYRPDIRLLSNPIDLDAYPYRARLAPQPRLLWLRTFHPIYNPALAPRALALLLAEWPEARLTMAGPDRGRCREETTQVAQGLGLLDHIAFQGPMPKSAVPAWLATGDIFLNTATVDNMPVSMVEAMAAGLVVISTRVGGVPHLARDGHDALLVPANDPDAMATAIRRVLTEPGLAAALSRQARARAARCDWSVVLPQWEELLTDVSRRARPTGAAGRSAGGCTPGDSSPTPTRA